MVSTALRAMRSIVASAPLPSSRATHKYRHCEGRSDEAIQTSFLALDCFACARNDGITEIMFNAAMVFSVSLLALRKRLLRGTAHIA
jgi:hypothetical protein